MPSDKSRLYVALYARAGGTPGGSAPTSYHWALIVGPKTEQKNDRGMRYHAKERMAATGQSTWVFESLEIPIQPTSMILVRIVVAKIVDPSKVESTLRAVPVVQNNPNWNCVTWVKDGLGALERSTCLGSSRLEWQAVQQAAMAYVTQKVKAHRFDGQVKVDSSKVPTYDLIDGKEIIQ